MADRDSFHTMPEEFQRRGREVIDWALLQKITKAKKLRLSLLSDRD